MSLKNLIDEKIKDININNIKIPENKKYSFAFGSGYYEGYFTFGFIRYIIFLYQNGLIKKENIDKLYGASVGNCAIFLLYAYLDNNNNKNIEDFDEFINNIMDITYDHFINGTNFISDILIDCSSKLVNHDTFYDNFNKNTYLCLLEFTDMVYYKLKTIYAPSELPDKRFQNNDEMIKYLLYSVNNPYFTSSGDKYNYYDSINIKKIEVDKMDADSDFLFVNCDMSRIHYLSKYICYDVREYKTIYLRGFSYAHEYFTNNQIDNETLMRHQVLIQDDSKTYSYYIGYKILLYTMSILFISLPRKLNIKKTDL